jgi:hypothetical protein
MTKNQFGGRGGTGSIEEGDWLRIAHLYAAKPFSHS